MKSVLTASIMLALTLAAFPAFHIDEAHRRLAAWVLLGLGLLVAIMPARSPRQWQVWFVAGATCMTIGFGAFVLFRFGS